MNDSVTRGVIRQAQTVMRPALANAIPLLAALLIGLTGAGFLLAATFGALSRSFGPDLSGLIIGLSLVVLSAVVLLVARHRRGARARAARQAEDAAAREPSLQDMGATAAFVAAFVLARQMAGRD